MTAMQIVVVVLTAALWFGAASWIARGRKEG